MKRLRERWFNRRNIGGHTKYQEGEKCAIVALAHTGAEPTGRKEKKKEKNVPQKKFFKKNILENERAVMIKVDHAVIAHGAVRTARRSIDVARVCRRNTSRLNAQWGGKSTAIFERNQLTAHDNILNAHWLPLETKLVGCSHNFKRFPMLTSGTVKHTFSILNFEIPREDARISQRSRQERDNGANIEKNSDRHHPASITGQSYKINASETQKPN